MSNYSSAVMKYQKTGDLYPVYLTLIKYYCYIAPAWGSNTELSLSTIFEMS